MDKGTLYLVSTPIGNYEDITLRALRILKTADILVCEEAKEGFRLLRQLEINRKFMLLNEHSGKEDENNIVLELALGKTVALFSDGGAPVFSDPGLNLVRQAIAMKIPVVPLPGANSVITALIASGCSLSSFYFAGWLSPESDERKQQLYHLKKRKELIVLMDTPYRLKKLLSECAETFPHPTYAVVAFELTTEKENFYRGTLQTLAGKAEKENLKGEFVLLIENGEKQ